MWLGVIFLFFSSIGNWGYTYNAHRKYEGGYPRKDALDLLSERYARGEIKQEEYFRIRSDLLAETRNIKRSA